MLDFGALFNTESLVGHKWVGLVRSLIVQGASTHAGFGFFPFWEQLTAVYYLSLLFCLRGTPFSHTTSTSIPRPGWTVQAEAIAVKIIRRHFRILLHFEKSRHDRTGQST